MSFKKRLTLLSLILVIGVILAACGDDEGETGDKSSADGLSTNIVTIATVHTISLVRR